jgi:AcrR family transcriptional regulator
MRRGSPAAIPTPNSPVKAEGPSLGRIFDGTLAALSRHGARNLSMTDIGAAAGISRATLYRYFTKKEELLAALAEYVTSNFVSGVKDAAAREREPQEKLRAVLQFTIDYSQRVRADRILEVEPQFVIEALHAQFPRHLAAVREALDPVFGALEKRLGCKLDRALITELLLRSQESTSLIPSGPSWSALPGKLAELAVLLLGGAGPRKPGSGRK